MGWLGLLLLIASSLLVFMGFGTSYYLHSIEEEFFSGMLLNVSTVFVEVAVIVVVIEQIMKSAERRKWRFAQRMISRSLSSSYLDVMRVLYASELRQGHPDREGFSEFLSVAGHHLAILRSYIEGFSPYLPEDVHEKARRFEAILQSLFRHFRDVDISTKDGFWLDSTRIFKQLQSICQEIYEFAKRYNQTETTVALASVQKAAGDKIPQVPCLGREMRTLDFAGPRWRLQDFVLEQYYQENPKRDPTSPGIRYDFDEELALRYVILDYLMFTEAGRRETGERGRS